MRFPRGRWVSVAPFRKRAHRAFYEVGGFLPKSRHSLENCLCLLGVQGAKMKVMK